MLNFSFPRLRNVFIYLYSFRPLQPSSNGAKRRIFWYRHFSSENFWIYRRTRCINISIKKSNKLLVSSEARYRPLPSKMRIDCVVSSNNPTLNYSYGRVWFRSKENDMCVFFAVVNAACEMDYVWTQDNQNKTVIFKFSYSFVISSSYCHRANHFIQYLYFVLRVDKSLMKHPKKVKQNYHIHFICMIRWRIFVSLTSLSLDL